MNKKILKVTLENSAVEGYITGVVTGGGKGLIESSAMSQLEGFTIFRQKVLEYNLITCQHEEVIKATKTTAFWTEEGVHVSWLEGREITPKVDIFAIRKWFSGKDCSKTHIKNRIQDFLSQDGVEVLNISVTENKKIHRKYINGRPILFNMVPGISQVIHKSGNVLIGSAFLEKTMPDIVPIKDFCVIDEDPYDDDFTL